MTLHDLLVGIDRSAASVGALRWAVGLAEELDANVRAMHVWRTRSPCLYPWAMASPQDAADYAWSVARTSFKEAGSPDRVEVAIANGNPGRCLVETSDGFDVVVVGCVGEELAARPPGSDSVALGSTARHVLHHSLRPIVAVPQDAVWRTDPRVAVGVDGSVNSFAALRWAVQELPAGARIHVVRAVHAQLPDGVVPNDYELLDPVVADAQRELDEWVATALEPTGLPGEDRLSTHVVFGSARDALVRPGFDVDMIVIGEHGETAAPHVLGSVSDHTLRYASVPIAVIPSPDRG